MRYVFLVLPAAPIFLVVASSGRALLSVIVVFSLLFFQSEGGIATAGKLAVLACVVYVIGVVRLRQPAKSRSPSTSVPVLQVFGVIAVVFSGVLGGFSGNKLEFAIRDLVGPLLILSAPGVGRKLGSQVRPGDVLHLIRLTAVLSSVSYFLYWSSTRGLISARFINFGVASWSLPLFCCLVLVVRKDTKRYDYFFASVGMLFLLFSGSRSILLPLSAFILGIVWSRTLPDNALHRRRQLRLVLPFSAALIISLLVARTLSINPGRLLDRTLSAFSLRTPRGDASYLERLSQARVGWATFKQFPIFGAGPGHVYQFAGLYGRLKGSYVLEAPSALFADFGGVGAFLLLLVLVSLTVNGYAVISRFDRNLAIAWASTLLSVILFSLVSNPFDDKGLFIVILLGASFFHSIGSGPENATDTRKFDGAGTPSILAPNITGPLPSTCRPVHARFDL